MLWGAPDGTGAQAPSEAGTISLMWRRASIRHRRLPVARTRRAPSSCASRMVKNSWSRQFTWSESRLGSPRSQGSSSPRPDTCQSRPPLAPGEDPRRRNLACLVARLWEEQVYLLLTRWRPQRRRRRAPRSRPSSSRCSPHHLRGDSGAARDRHQARPAAARQPPALRARSRGPAADLPLDTSPGADHAGSERPPRVGARAGRRHVRGRRPAAEPSPAASRSGRTPGRCSTTGWRSRPAPPSSPPSARPTRI